MSVNDKKIFGFSIKSRISFSFIAGALIFYENITFLDLFSKKNMPKLFILLNFCSFHFNQKVKFMEEGKVKKNYK